LSDGGTAYGVPTGSGGFAPTLALFNNVSNPASLTNLVFYGSGVGGVLPSQDGSFPGGGGACGYYGGGDGANGLVIIRW